MGIGPSGHQAPADAHPKGKLAVDDTRQPAATIAQRHEDEEGKEGDNNGPFALSDTCGNRRPVLSRPSSTFLLASLQHSSPPPSNGVVDGSILLKSGYLYFAPWSMCWVEVTKVLVGGADCQAVGKLDVFSTRTKSTRLPLVFEEQNDLRLRVAPLTTRGAGGGDDGGGATGGDDGRGGEDSSGGEEAQGGVGQQSAPPAGWSLDPHVFAGESHPQVEIDGMYAGISVAVPSEWLSMTAELSVVDAVPFMAESALENVSDVAGNIALVLGGEVHFKLKAKRASEAGAIGVIIVNTEDEVFEASDNISGYECGIPVLMIKSSDASRLREQGGAIILKGAVERSWEKVARNGAAGKSALALPIGIPVAPSPTEKIGISEVNDGANDQGTFDVTQGSFRGRFCARDRDEAQRWITTVRSSLTTTTTPNDVHPPPSTTNDRPSAVIGAGCATVQSHMTATLDDAPESTMDHPNYDVGDSAVNRPRQTGWESQKFADMLLKGYAGSILTGPGRYFERVI